MLTGDEGLLNPNVYWRLSSYHVLSYLVKLRNEEARDIVYLHILPLLYEGVGTKQYDHLSKREIDIYLTPKVSPSIHDRFQIWSNRSYNCKPNRV